MFKKVNDNAPEKNPAAVVGFIRIWMALKYSWFLHLSLDYIYYQMDYNLYTMSDK